MSFVHISVRICLFIYIYRERERDPSKFRSPQQKFQNFLRVFQPKMLEGQCETPHKRPPGSEAGFEVSVAGPSFQTLGSLIQNPYPKWEMYIGFIWIHGDFIYPICGKFQKKWIICLDEGFASRRWKNHLSLEVQ